MPSQVNVRSVDALIDLKHSLARYAHEVNAPLVALEHEAARTLEWLDERRRYWQREAQNARQVVDQARAALARCESTVYRDSQSGATRGPDCSPHRVALARAVAHLRSIEGELRKVEQAKRSVEQAHIDFHRQQRRLRSFLERDLAEAQSFLERRAESLRAYGAAGLPAGHAVTAPTEALADLFTMGVFAGAVGLTAVAIGAVKVLAGSLQSALGDTGETLTERLLRAEPGWRALPFDQPKHGFDRVFTAPGLPLIVVESKVNRAGKLRLGRPQSGEQASPAWIAAQAAQMADPESKQYSPDNAAIAALVEELGPEHVPAVAVVITTETGAVGIHFRRAGGDEWVQLAEGANLTELLQTPSD